MDIEMKTQCLLCGTLFERKTEYHYCPECWKLCEKVKAENRDFTAKERTQLKIRSMAQ